MMEENLSDFLLFLIHSNKFHKNKIRRTIFNQKSSTWKSKKYIKEEWIPISYSLSEQTHKQMTKKSKPRNQEICWIWIVPQPIDTRRDTLSLTGISAPTSIEIFDRAFSFPVFHRRAHIFLSLSVGGGGGK